MHQLITTNSMKMTSREIAELVESRHDKVKQSIERLAAKGVIESPPMGNFRNSNNVEGQEYIFTGEQGKRDSIIVVAQLSPEFTARLVDRWQELERRSIAPANPAQMSRLQLIQLAMQAEQERLQLENTVDELKPRAAVADRLTGATGNMSIRDSAKSLKIAERTLVLWLLEHKWLYRDMKGRLRGYSDKTPKYIEHKVTPIPSDTDADRVSMQPMITPAGLARLADIFNVEDEVYQEAA
jgi:phage regulator Rha-like protein